MYGDNLLNLRKLSLVMPTISLCMITKNEEVFLDKCLKSVKPLVDEIIVVDTGSTDNTKNIAKKYTKNVFDFPWTNSFSDARNESLKYATKEWIFVLDADEKVAKQDHGLIKQLTNEKDVDAFLLEQRNYTTSPALFGWIACTGEYTEEKGFEGYYPFQTIRLFRNSKQVKYQNRVHETIKDSVHRVGKTTIPIHHFGRINGLSPEKLITYLELGKRDLNEHPNDLHSHYEIALIYHQLNDIESGISHITEIIKKNPGFRHTLTILGILSVQRGDLNTAFLSFKKSVQMNPRDETAAHYLGVLYEKAGKIDEALSYFEKARSLNPSLTTSWINSARIYINQKKYNEAHALVDTAMTTSKDPILVSVKAEIYLAEGKYHDAIRMVKKFLRKENSASMINLYWNLSTMYEERGDIKRAIDILEDAVKLKPKETEPLVNRIADLKKSA